MASIKQESEDPVPCTSQETTHTTNEVTTENKVSVKCEAKAEPKYFHCEICGLRECYDYFGNDPPFVKHYKLTENAYIIEDPFVPPKQNEFIVLGSHCIQCGKCVCKDNNCSLYYESTFCIFCVKKSANMFPDNIKEKLNRIIT